MGLRNFLVEGVSGTGKTAVCHELQRRGYDAVNGDRELAYQGDPETGEVTDRAGHGHHVWDVSRVRARVADHREPVTFFCGGSRNFSTFIDLFDGVFVLDVDLETLLARLDQRPADEWGAEAADRELIVRLHHTKEDIPRTGVVIDLFDGVFVLDVDLETLLARLDQRPADEWGAEAADQELIVRLHHTKEDIPRTGVVIDAKPPLTEVVDEILRHVRRANADTGTA